MTRDDLAAALDGIPGWLELDEAYALHLLAQLAGTAVIEIGSYHGRSTIALATGTPEGVPVYSIDPHHTHTAGGILFTDHDGQAWMLNVLAAGVGAKVKPVMLPSRQAHLALFDAVPWVDLVFIDGAHDEETVRADFYNSSLRLGVGGKIAVHDSTGAWDGPTCVVAEAVESGKWRIVQTVCHTHILEKVVYAPG